MDSGKQLEFSPGQKVYRPSPKRYLKLEVLTSGVFPVVSFGFLFLVILLSPIFSGHPEQLFSVLPIDLIFLGPFEVFFVFYLLWRTRLRLVTSVEGIDYSTVGYHIFTPWDNVAGFGTRQEFFQPARGRGWTREIGGLELHQPAPVYRARPLVRLFLRLHGIERPSFFIPVSDVVENWQDKVAADIQHYAPQTAMKMPFFRGASLPDVKTLLQRDDIEGLIAALTDPADEIREAAARALGYSEDPRGVDPLIAALQDTGYRVREAAADALGYLGDARAVDSLVQVVLQDRDVAVLEVAARALGQIGDVRAVEVLISIAQDQGNHDSGAIQTRVAFTLRTLQKNKGYREEVRKAATAALKQIKSSERKSR